MKERDGVPTAERPDGGQVRRRAGQTAGRSDGQTAGRSGASRIERREDEGAGREEVNHQGEGEISLQVGRVHGDMQSSLPLTKRVTSFCTDRTE